MQTNVIKNTAKQVVSVIDKNSPKILTGLGIAGVISTTVLAVKATPKALQIIEAEKEDNDELKPVDILKATWKCYIPAGIMAGVTIACIVGANTINTKRNIAIAGLYSMAKEAAKDIEEAATEVVGDKKLTEIKDVIAKKKIDENPPKEETIIMTGYGDVLCYDAFSGRYFMSNIEKIRKVQNDLNQQMISDIWVSLNDVYYALGLPCIKSGDNMGWNSYHDLIDFHFSTQLTKDGKPCIVVDFIPDPKFDFKEWHVL